jgi:hypothetical protein
MTLTPDVRFALKIIAIVLFLIAVWYERDAPPAPGYRIRIGWLGLAFFAMSTM